MQKQTAMDLLQDINMIAYVNTKGDKTLSEYKYEYDGQDNVISETINGVVNSYDYNESDELKASTKND